MSGRYTLRYIAGTELRFRKHTPTVAKFETWIEAEDHRLAQPNSDQLEVVQR